MTINITTIDKLALEKDCKYNILFTYCPHCNEEVIIYTKVCDRERR